MRDRRCWAWLRPWRAAWVHRGLPALAVALACTAADAQVLRLAVSRGPVSLPIYVADAEGFFDREGIAVQMRGCASGRQCFQMLREGQSDLATAAELLVTLASFDNSDHAIIATLSSSARHIKLVARRNAGIAVPADLKGKRIATVAGTSAQYFLDSWLIYHEIDPGEVRIVPLAPDQLGNALRTGEADAIAIWEPIAGSAIDAIGANAVVLPSPRIYTQHFALVAHRQTIGQRAADVVKLLRALERAERFIADEPARARQILTARLAGERGADNMAEHDFRLTLGQSLIATMEAQARWALRSGQVPAGKRPGNLLRSIEPALLRQAAPGAVDLVQ